MDYVRSILGNWISAEPTASLWLVVGSALLFGVTFLHLRSQDERAWGRHLLEALSTGLAFAALAGMLYFLSNSSYSTFNRVFGPFVSRGSLSNQAWAQWNKIYGGGYYQRDLTVTQTITVETEEIVQPSDPSAAAWVRKIKTEQPVTQNNIDGFRGDVTINHTYSGNQKNGFNAYALTAKYEYDVINPTETNVHTVFLFPLSQGSKLYQDIRIQADGQDVDWKIVGGAITWERWMSPGEKNLISISFVTSGMDGFDFEIPQQREVVNFNLLVRLDMDNTGPYTQPENGGIQLNVTNESGYKIIHWKIEKAILAPRLGVTWTQYWPYAPYQEMISTLKLTTRSLLFFLCLAVLTLVICATEVRLAQIALLGGLFLIPSLILMSGGVPHPASITPALFADYQIKMLPIISILPLALACLILRKIPRLPMILLLVLMALWMGGYPFAGLLDEQKRNAFEAIVQAAMIAYVFVLTLFVRLKGQEKN